MKIDILGTEYELTQCHESDDPRMQEADGFCDETAQEICINNFEGETGQPGAKKDLSAYSRKVLRHEIVHAFLFESGLAENSEWAQNEELVDWFAMQGPKIWKAWQEAGAV